MAGFPSLRALLPCGKGGPTTGFLINPRGAKDTPDFLTWQAFSSKMAIFVPKSPDIGTYYSKSVSIMNQARRDVMELEANKPGQVGQRHLHLQADAPAGEDDGIELLRGGIDGGPEGFFHADGGTTAMNIAGERQEFLLLEHLERFERSKTRV